MSYADVAAWLSDTFDLTRPPIGIAFVASPPEGVEEFAGEVPSACSFWTHAENGSFYATSAQHLNCPIGALTMGFPLDDTVQKNLMDAVGLMCANGYVTEAEPNMLPSVPGDKSGVVYGPLAELPVYPNVILMWLTPRQAMVYNEAIGSANWGASERPLFGRPTCAAIPVALDGTKPAMSFGCLGMRTYTEIPDDLVLAVVPTAALERFMGELAKTSAANDTMAGFYGAQKARFPALAH
jgi:uncharacterized protein (DUF169 family)